ncbi:MAG TPA: glycoside hydrolase family 15 protein [Burkholderiaceae bacterium]|nr:glycoside hydrolase family 15 protein [Burkholderiaceae bacterium]
MSHNRMDANTSSSLDLAVIGNSRVGALVDTHGRLVWMCVPRFDGDPVFCALLDSTRKDGCFAIDLDHRVRVEQAYLRNSPILRTEMHAADGSAIEIIDFSPRFYQHGRMFAPVSVVRLVRRIAGRPRIAVQFAPRCEYGAQTPPLTFGSHHVRALVPSYSLRLTTDAPITHVVERRAFILDDAVSFVLGPDETLADSPREAGQRLFNETLNYWHRWVRNLAIPFEWQDAVIRAAITLKLNAFEDTGAIIAALTTSIPEAPNTERNWDYRFCWLRDAYFVVNALNRLGATASMERYLRYIENIVADADDAVLQPLYTLSGVTRIDESNVSGLPGYRGMGPVRVGNLAYVQKQHDVYGSAILGVTHAFFDRRMTRVGDETLFMQLERFGHQAYALHNVPDAGIWEFRGREAVHTFSSLMCWAACDRLMRIAKQLGLQERAQFWAGRASEIRTAIDTHAWSDKLGGYAATFGGESVDASLLLIGELEYLAPNDPRFRGTVEAIEQRLRRGDFLLRYAEADDFGMPETAFLVCTFWWIQALARMGDRDRARALFEQLLSCRNRFGLLSEDIDTRTRELWGNFPQTYSMVGIIMCAMRLSVRWDDAI